jgi:hypothetical protein
MQHLLLLLFGLLLASSATLVGFVSGIERTFANPDYYAAAIERSNLSPLAVPLAEKLSGANGKLAQVLQLGIKRIEPQLKQQTITYLKQFYQALRGTQGKVELVYDLSALRSENAFKAEVIELLKEDSKTGRLSKNRIQPAAQTLIGQLPEKIDLLNLAGVDDRSLESLLNDARLFLAALDRWLLIGAGLCLLSVVLIFLAARSLVRSLLVTGVSLLLSAGLLVLPWLFSDAILATMNPHGPIYEMLKQTGLWNNLAAELSSSYLLSPMAAAAMAAVCLVAAMVARRFGTQAVGA